MLSSDSQPMAVLSTHSRFVLSLLAVMFLWLDKRVVRVFVGVLASITRQGHAMNGGRVLRALGYRVTSE